MTRGLVAIPAFNEEGTIVEVVSGVRRAVPELDVLVINDGSLDKTGQVLQQIGVTTATHLANLGYGRAMQTAIKYAAAHDYDFLVTFDADGQHQPEDIRRLYLRFKEGAYDLLIGSRFIQTRRYRTEPIVRRIGMHIFSLLVRVLTGRRIFDTTSGMKAIHRRVFRMLTLRPSVDFHAEVIIYLMLRGCHVGEHPISISPRQHGVSMYSPMSSIKYPLKIALLVLLNAVEAKFVRGRPYE